MTNLTQMSTTKVDTPMEQLDYFRQLVQLVEKKKRNLEKKKNKLDDHRAKVTKGEPLNPDQLKALERYDGVVQSLECVKELTDQAFQLANEMERLAKKAAKKEKAAVREKMTPEPEIHTTAATEIVPEPQKYVDNEKIIHARLAQDMKMYLQIQEVLSDLGNEEYKRCFIEGTYGAIKLTEEDFANMDKFYSLFNPIRQDSDSAQFEKNLELAAANIARTLKSSDVYPEGIEVPFYQMMGLFNRILASDFYVLGKRPPIVNGTNEPTGSENKDYSQDNHYNFDNGSASHLNNDAYSHINNCQPADQGHTVESLTNVIKPLRSDFNFLQDSQVSSEQKQEVEVTTGVSDIAPQSECSAVEEVISSFEDNHILPPEQQQTVSNTTWAESTSANVQGTWAQLVRVNAPPPVVHAPRFTTAPTPKPVSSSFEVDSNKQAFGQSQETPNGDVFSTASQSAFLPSTEEDGWISSSRSRGGRQTREGMQRDSYQNGGFSRNSGFRGGSRGNIRGVNNFERGGRGGIAGSRGSSGRAAFRQN